MSGGGGVGRSGVLGGCRACRFVGRADGGGGHRAGDCVGEGGGGHQAGECVGEGGGSLGGRVCWAQPTSQKRPMGARPPGQLPAKIGRWACTPQPSTRQNRPMGTGGGGVIGRAGVGRVGMSGGQGCERGDGVLGGRLSGGQVCVWGGGVRRAGCRAGVCFGRRGGVGRAGVSDWSCFFFLDADYFFSRLYFFLAEKK